MLQGTYSYLLQDDAGQVSLDPLGFRRAGLSSVGPEHAALHDSGRAEYVSASDEETLRAAMRLARSEGIVPALESAHAVAHCDPACPRLAPDDILVVNVSGWGDKDMGIWRREASTWRMLIKPVIEANAD